LHLLDDAVGDPADGVLGDARAVDVGEVCRDLPGRQPAGVEAEDDLVDLT